MRTGAVQHPILVVEPDAAVRTALTYSLRREGYVVFALGDSSVAFDLARENPLALLLLDPGAQSEDGLSLCRQLRSCEVTEQLPIVFFVNRESEIVQITQLGLHVADYLLKPLLWEEVSACVHTLIRSGRRQARPQPVKMVCELSAEMVGSGKPLIVIDDLCIDTVQQVVTKHGQALALGNSMLFPLLLYFVRHRGIALSRADLLVHVWGHERLSVQAYHERTVSVHVHQLRKILGDDPIHPQWIKTVRGVGYRFQK